MSLLLDTQVLLWCLSEPRRLAPKARRRIESSGQVVFVSAVSAWEMEIKRALGKLEAPSDLGAQLGQLGFTELPIRLAHVTELGSLPSLHRDPFDRMLVAQARVEQLTLVTADEQLLGYPVKLLAAR